VQRPATSNSTQFAKRDRQSPLRRGHHPAHQGAAVAQKRLRRALRRDFWLRNGRGARLGRLQFVTESAGQVSLSPRQASGGNVIPRADELTSDREGESWPRTTKRGSGGPKGDRNCGKKSPGCGPGDPWRDLLTEIEIASRGDRCKTFRQ